MVLQEKIVLTADEAKPFYCPKKFKAKKIMYTHEFKQITGQGGVSRLGNYSITV